MNSFPGMNPYLENPIFWADVHQGLISTLRIALNRILPPNYVARAGERCQVVPSERSVYPDVFVRSTPKMSGNTATIAPPNEVLNYDVSRIIEEIFLEPIEPYIEIVSSNDAFQVITAIEILSPSNKEYGTNKRSLYLKKQQEILAGSTHLIEIDLLRNGFPTVACQRHDTKEKRNLPYTVCLHRGNESRRYEVWEIALNQKLPRIPIPLESGVPDIVIDLQEIFNQNYDDSLYDRTINYSQSPFPNLDLEAMVWLDHLLKGKGKREK